MYSDRSMEVAARGKAKRRHLSTEDCRTLGQSAEGTGALTHPLTVPKGHDPNSRLYPRTPTKRRKCASVAGSPVGKQRGIGEFFSVTGVLSSSPQKPPQPCSSTHRLRGELFPTEKPEVPDEDDVSSLLDDELDDASLLESVREAEAAQWEEMDYLEGMTAEMFGDDDHFENSGLHEEEVEPLPDAHFGLLGSSKVLLQPQGCMTDLPEEVLRQVLCLLPAQDLYRNARRVCHRWKAIIDDTKFMPFKKQYYRYMVREKETVQQVASVLMKNGITHPSWSQNSIRNLVVFMASHPVGERVCPAAVLERVKKHRLFLQAEASIRLRMPNVPKCTNSQGPNPYAAMAVVLILSESVADVQDLVSLLAGCMSHTAIKEYLSHMATMLLAMRRSSIQISNRLHYNIYYVLHLMENGPFSVSSGESRSPGFQLTYEQQQILSHEMKRDHVVKIIAFAGTGKTTMLVKYAEQRPHMRFLYVAFNKSVAREAAQRFPGNVDCRTVHSLAYKDVGRKYHMNDKLTLTLTPFSLNSVLPEGRSGFAKAKVVATTLKTFMASADATLSTAHVPESQISRSGIWTFIEDKEKELFARDAERIWKNMKDLNMKEHYRITHDGYLKLWQLQNPKPCLSDHYDVLFIDEAQDCTPAIMDVLLSQRCGKVLVGDPHQQIYTFRGAVNALQTASHTHIYYLTQSFRFGAEIAYVGATLLEVCKRVQKILVGGNQNGGVCDHAADQAVAAVTSGVTDRQGKIAILSRCNFSMFTKAVELTDANPHCRIHFIGGVKNIGLSKILDIWKLMKKTNTQPNCFNDNLIRSFASITDNAGNALRTYVTLTDDLELDGKLRIIDKYRERIPELVKRLGRVSEARLSHADFILSTVHKAKGLEFDTVMVTDDFAKIPCSRHNLHHRPEFSFSKIAPDEWNLLYVAVTRARTSLIITKNIRRLMTVAGEYFLTSEVPSTPANVNETPPCVFTSCPNCITPGSAFTMFRRQMICSDGVSKGGPMCERCVWTRIGSTAFLMTDDVLSMAAIRRIHDPPVHRVVLIIP